VCKNKYIIILKLNFKYNDKIIYLIERQTSRTKIKLIFIGHNDPVIFNGKVIDQRIKGTLGITG